MGVIISQDGSYILGNDTGIMTTATVLDTPSVSYDPDAEVIFAAMVPEPDADRKALLNAFVVGCKADLSLNGETSNWTECDTIRIRAAHASQPMTLNLKDPSLFTSTLELDPTFVVDRYVAGDGATSYINNNWKGTDGVKYTLNDASYGIYILNEVGAGIVMGAYEGANFSYISPNDGGLFYGVINGAAESTVANASSIGLFGVSRTDALEQKLWIDGGLVFTGAVASTIVPTIDFWECALDGTASFSLCQNAASWTGSGQVDQLKLKARFDTYLTAVGAI